MGHNPLWKLHFTQYFLDIYTVRYRIHIQFYVPIFTVFIQQTKCISDGAIPLACPPDQGATHMMQIGRAVIKFSQWFIYFHIHWMLPFFHSIHTTHKMHQ